MEHAQSVRAGAWLLILLNLLMEALTLVLDPEYSPLPVQSQGDLDGLSLGGEAQGIG